MCPVSEAKNMRPDLFANRLAYRRSLLLAIVFHAVASFSIQSSSFVQRTSMSISKVCSSPVPRHDPITMNFGMNYPRINEWKVLNNGRVVGTVTNHPNIPDGDTITTSPITRPDQAAPRAVVRTVSGSRYTLGAAMKGTGGRNQVTNLQSLQRRARVAFGLSGDIVGDDSRKYLLAGRPAKSTSGKSQIYKAYRADVDGLPTGDALTVKVSKNWEAIEREAENYASITKSGFLRGQFVELIDFLPEASEFTSKYRGQSALVMERGAIDLKRYIAINGKLEGPELRDAAAAAAQCVQAIHASGLVWTDMKTENFVVDPNGVVKGIDLESAMPVKGNPVDYSPEGTPPEFARAFLAGDGPYFVLQYSYDIWSLGILFYELATGTGYFDGKSPAQITKQLRDGIEVDLSAIEDPTFRDMVSKCLQKDPKKRQNIVQILLHPYFLKSGIGPVSFK